MPTSVPPSSGVDRKRHPSADRLKKRHQERKTGKQPPNKHSPHSPLPFLRLLIVWSVLVGGSLGLAVNLYQLQVIGVDGKINLLQQARKQQTVNLRPYIPRRPVVDRNNNVLAMDRPVYTLYAHPKLFTLPKDKIASKLAKILNRPATDFVKQFSTRATGIKVATAIPEETADDIALLRLSGLELEQQHSRLYPQHNLFADVVGYVDSEHRGQAGVEYSQEKLLERTSKEFELRRTGNGGIISYHVPDDFLEVEKLRLQLTLDTRLQRAAQSSLKQQLQKFNAKRGSVIVMDVRDGAILALAEEPSFDPNVYYKGVELFRNWAISDLYEPGSTFKPINVAIALEAGVLKPNEVFHDPGTIKVGGRVIKNAEKKDLTDLSVAQILQHSSNVGMVQIMQRMPPATYYSWLKRLSLGQKVNTDLPFAVASQIKNQKQFVSYPIESATASFGQGFSLTPLHLVQLHAALANGGKLVTPHVVRGLFNTEGQLHQQPALPAPQPIFLPKTAQTVLEMMETVVIHGSGKTAAIPGYRIAGKTGTAEKADSRGGYSSGAYITSFIGILPVESPRYVVLAVVDEPRKKGELIFGSTVAAPVVKSVMEALVTIEQIPPSQNNS